MVRPLITLLLTLAALAPPSEAAASGGEPSKRSPALDAEIGPSGDEGPPPGSAADVALWRAGRAVNEAIWVERSRSARLQLTVTTNRLLERLEAAATKAGPKDGPALQAARQRLLKACQGNYELFVRQWPVDPTRGCGYPLLTFDSALRSPPGDGGELGSARGELRQCIDRARPAVKAITESNQVLEAARAEAEVALRPARQAPGGEEDERHEQHERHEAAEGVPRGKGGE
jgi:hypothetical protein